MPGLPTTMYEPIRCQSRQRLEGQARMRPSTSQPISSVLVQRIQDAHRQLQRRFFQDVRGSTATRPQRPLGNQSLSDIQIAPRRRRDQPRNGCAIIENLDLAPTTSLSQVAIQVRLQFGNRYRAHGDKCSLDRRTQSSRTRMGSDAIRLLFCHTLAYRIYLCSEG